MLSLALALVVSQPYVRALQGRAADGGTAWHVQGESTPSAYFGTLFGHSRVATPYTLGDVINTYGLDAETWGTDGGGSWTQLPFESAIRLEGDGGSVYLETHRKYRYQAARQQTILQTAMLESSRSAGVLRWGNFCTHDGLFWQWGADGGALEVCRRTSAERTDGGFTDYCASVDAGSGYAPQNGNIYEIRFAWLGVHETDWYLNGRLLLSQNYDGKLTNVYMSTGTLPLRAEAHGSAKMKYVCSNVTSEGGQQPPSPGFSYSRAATKIVAPGAGILPIVALRPQAIATFSGEGVHSHIELVPSSISCQSTNATKTRIYSYLNPTLTGATWAVVPTSSAAEVDIAATATSGGIQVCTFGADEGTHELHHVFGVNQRALRVRALGQPADVLVVAADSITGNQDVTCAIEWQEIR